MDPAEDSRRRRPSSWPAAGPTRGRSSREGGALNHSKNTPRSSPNWLGVYSQAPAIFSSTNVHVCSFRSISSEQVAAVAGFDEFFGANAQFVVGDESLPPRDFFGGSDLEALALFDGAHVVRGVEQGIEGAGVEPGGAAGQYFDLQAAGFEVVRG